MLKACYALAFDPTLVPRQIEYMKQSFPQFEMIWNARDRKSDDMQNRFDQYADQNPLLQQHFDEYVELWLQIVFSVLDIIIKKYVACIPANLCMFDEREGIVIRDEKLARRVGVISPSIAAIEQEEAEYEEDEEEEEKEWVLVTVISHCKSLLLYILFSFFKFLSYY